MQTIPFLSALDFASLRTTEDVASVLNELNQHLASSPLERLQNFNKTYVIITENVQRKLKNQAFDYPGFLNNFDAQFACYYLDALRNYTLGKPVPPAWRATFDAARDATASPLKIMALGVNAHVNNDIPQALQDCHADTKHKNDFMRVNSMIAESIDTVIHNLQPSSSVFSPHHQLTKAVYKPFMHAVIIWWRFAAWHNYWKLQSDIVSIKHVENRAHVISKGAKVLPI
ncbi:MAG: DUF5995 family protein [Patescibacteria group bacterium]|nr:DUF5995 family protein [Patescibacteria group bacterium]